MNDLSNQDLQGANLQDANLRGADLRGVNLQGADLRGANLVIANLQDANLQGANLQGANLQDANLQGADLQGADLQYANLQDINLQGANLQGAIGLHIAADASARLQAVASAALASDSALSMSTWHKCNTTHCIAGWAIHQAGEPGKILESVLGPSIAGLLLLGPEAYTHFHDTDEQARAWLQSVLNVDGGEL